MKRAVCMLKKGYQEELFNTGTLSLTAIRSGT